MARTRPLTTLFHALVWPSILIALAGWIIALAGLAASQRSCNSDLGLLTQQQPQFHQVSTLPAVGCHATFRWPWWILWGSLLPILGVAIAAMSNRAHPGWVTPFIGVTAVFCTLSMIAANLSLNLVDAFWGIGGPILNRSQVMFSGFLILAAGLLLMLFALGAAMEGRGAEDDEDLYAGGKRGGAGRVQQQQPTTVTYGAPTGAATGVRTTGATP